MRFLDSIGQVGPESRRGASRPHVDQPLTENVPARAIEMTPLQEPPRSERPHAVVMWSAVLMVVAAVATAAWLGIRNFNIVIPPPAETAADTSPDAQAGSEKPRVKARRARPRVAARSANAIDAASVEPPGDITSNELTSTIDPASEVAIARAVEAAAAETTSESTAAPVVEAPPEDNYVYSSDGTGVVAPQLVSLGFANALAKGFEARTSRLELVISKSGTVERATVFSAPRNWEDAMLLSRAKTFRFVPAQRNGLPVRYRYVMEIATAP